VTPDGGYDVVVVGSGFGGSVAALRLAEKGYRVAVLEAGRRFSDADFPRTSWDVRNFLWAPRLGCKGIQRIHWLKDVVVLAGAGVGGGSLNYANTLYVPPKAFFDDPQWREITDWESELAPYFDQAQRMLGVVDNQSITSSDEQFKSVADAMGVGHTFRLTPVGVFFGEGPGAESEDPFFGGVGPRRTGCLECGSCMTGCRHGAKNTLPKNYLGLAERAGARVFAETTVVGIGRRRDGRWDVTTEPTGSWFAARRGRRTTWTATDVVLAAGTMGTQRLLHRMVAAGRLRGVSPMLGRMSRTNSEALVGAWGRDPARDFTRGVAITSSFHVDEHTHVEAVRYGKGSNAMGLLGTVLVPPGQLPRWLSWLSTIVLHPVDFGRALSVRRWSERSLIALVMQDLDNSIVVRPKKRLVGGWGLTTSYGHGEPNPTWIPAAGEVAQRLADDVGGVAGQSIGDVFNAPMTAHFLGGCVIGDSPATGVIDGYHRVFGNPGLHVVDGAAVSANLGVNPSLTITAQAERAMAMWPNCGEADPRPPLDSAYRPVSAVAPHAPVVPESAPGALRLP
jgi:cholesterol oxidase